MSIQDRINSLARQVDSAPAAKPSRQVSRSIAMAAAQTSATDLMQILRSDDSPAPHGSAAAEEQGFVDTTQHLEGAVVEED